MKKVQVGVMIPKKELEEMRKVTRVDLNGPTVLSLARMGLQYQKQLEHRRETMGKRSVGEK